MALPNRMSLRPGLLWLTLNLALIIQCLSWNNIFIFFLILRIPQDVFVYPRLNTTGLAHSLVTTQTELSWHPTFIINNFDFISIQTEGFYNTSCLFSINKGLIYKGSVSVILNKRVTHSVDSSGSGQGQGAGSCEHTNEPWGNFLD
jgi:hypothetical protein